jgi:PAS domain S-box-containing protein
MDISFNPNLPTSNHEHDTLQNPQSLKRRLEVYEARMNGLLATLPQIVWLADANGSVTHFNPRWYEYTGLTASQSLGWNFLKAIHPDDCIPLHNNFATSAVTSHETASNKPQVYPRKPSFYPQGDEVANVHRAWFRVAPDGESVRQKGNERSTTNPKHGGVRSHSPENEGLLPSIIECRIRGVDGTYRWFIGQRTPVKGANGQILEWIGTYTIKDEPLGLIEDGVSGKGERESSVFLIPGSVWTSGENSPLGSQPQESSPRSVELTPRLSCDRQPPGRLCLKRQVVDKTNQSVPLRRHPLVDELSRVIIWEADAITEQFTFVSQSAERLLGYPLERWLMEPNFWVNLIHPDDRQWTVALCRKKISQCRDYELEYRCLAADKRVVWLRDRAYMIRDEQGRVRKRRGLMVDITLAKLAEAELQVRLCQQAAIAQLAQQALSGTQVSALIDECLSLICQTLAVEYCQVWEFLPDGNTLQLRAGIGWHDGLAGDTRISANVNSQIGYTLQSRQPVIVEDLRHETRFRGSPLLDDQTMTIGGVSVMIGGASSATLRTGEAQMSTAKEQEQGRLPETEQQAFTLSPERVWSNTVSNREDKRDKRDKGDKEDKEDKEDKRDKGESSYQLTTDNHTPPEPFGVLAIYTSKRRVFAPTDVDFLQSVANVLAGAMQSQQTDRSLHEAKTQLAQMTVALEKRSKDLDEFAYITSHDLKAPLRAIAHLSQWIEEDIADQLNSENLHQLQLLRRRVYRLEALLEGLLQYSRAGRLQSQPELVDVTVLLEQVIKTLQPPAQFRTIVAPGMPTFIAQRSLLKHVFTHLIDNAIKHHPSTDGTVTIDVKERSDSYEFAVADDGAGIAAQFHSKVFAIFQTLQPRDTVENTGVGLAIAKRIVESTGGTIRVESQDGQGATFYFTWPKVSTESI